MSRFEPAPCVSSWSNSGVGTRRILWTLGISLVMVAGCIYATRFSAERFAAPKHATLAEHDSTRIPEPFRVDITADEKQWRVRYPSVEGRPAMLVEGPASRSIHVPVGTKIVLALKSDDYVYTIGIPHFGLKEIAVPELEFRMEFRPTRIGRIQVIGEKMCGDPHTDIHGQLIVESQDRLLQWLNKASANSPAISASTP